MTIRIVGVTGSLQAPSKTITLVESITADLAQRLAAEVRLIKVNELGPSFAGALSRAEVSPEVEALRAQHQYLQALERIASLRPAIDTFFDQVMVMAPEAHLRNNRLALIASVLNDFSRIADFSEIVAG